MELGTDFAYVNKAFSASSDDDYNSDIIDSDIEAELYSSIHHDMSFTDTEKLNFADFKSENTSLQSEELQTLSHNSNNTKTIRTNSGNSKKRKLDLVEDVLDSLKYQYRSKAQIEILEVSDGKQSKKVKKDSTSNHCKNGKNQDTQPLLCGDSSDSEESIIFIDSNSVKDLKTNINGDTIAISSDSDESSKDVFARLNKSMSSSTQTSQAKDPWHINDTDLFPSKRHKGRYHGCQIKCTSCNAVGHSAKSCPIPKALKCYICGDNHLGSQCINKACHKCLEKGHDSRLCRNSFAHHICALCNMRGHIVKNCPDLWRRYHLSTSKKLIKGKFIKRERKKMYCFNCGNSGHFGGECDNSRNDKWCYRTWPCVITYEPPPVTLNNLRGRNAHGIHTEHFGNEQQNVPSARNTFASPNPISPSSSSTKKIKKNKEAQEFNIIDIKNIFDKLKGKDNHYRTPDGKVYTKKKIIKVRKELRKMAKATKQSINRHMENFENKVSELLIKVQQSRKSKVKTPKCCR